MTLHVLLDDVTSGSSTGAAVQAQNYRSKEYGIVQVKITNAATVKLQGRTSANLEFEDILDSDLVASGAIRVTLFPLMRATVAGNNGTTRVELFE